jgi:hypothetical protein
MSARSILHAHKMHMTVSLSVQSSKAWQWLQDMLQHMLAVAVHSKEAGAGLMLLNELSWCFDQQLYAN